MAIAQEGHIQDRIKVKWRCITRARPGRKYSNSRCKLLDWLLDVQKNKTISSSSTTSNHPPTSSSNNKKSIIEVPNTGDYCYLKFCYAIISSPSLSLSLPVLSLAAGVSILVLAYTALGSILFATLEGELENDMGTMETAVAASKPFPRTDLANADIRSR